jgi:Ca2+/Na+ antiporter
MSELALAAIGGSVAANATATLGITAVVTAPLHTGPVRASAVLAVAVAALLVIAASAPGLPRRLAGSALVTTYLVFVAVVLR